MTFRTGIFPSAGSAHVWFAAESGIFKDFDLDVEVVTVRSSDEQMKLWDNGSLAAMHTSPDHLLRTRRRDPVAVRAEGLGHLTVYAHKNVRLDSSQSRWGVDGIDSAFALVFRAILEDIGHTITDEELVAVGGTLQRFNALAEGTIDGTTLHAPFDELAENKGFTVVGDHMAVIPELLTVAAVVARDDLASKEIQNYLSATDRARAHLIAEGPRAVSAVLKNRDWSADAALVAGRQVCSTAGLGRDPAAIESGLKAALQLRRRYIPDWKPDREVSELVVEY